MFGALSLDSWRARMFALCWHQHGGSGLSIDWASALELPVEDQRALLELVADRREAEAKAIRGEG